MTIQLSTLGALLLGCVIGYLVQRTRAQRKAEKAALKAARDATTLRDGGTGEER